MAEDTPALGTGAGVPGPTFDASGTGLRKRGTTSGGTELAAAVGDIIEAYWSVSGADLVQLSRDGAPIGEPDRVTDGSCPVWLAGLDAGTYSFKLTAGVAGFEQIRWASDSAIELSLTLTPPLAIAKFWADPEPDSDGKDHLPQDLQLANGSKAKLQLNAVGATQVQITATPEGGAPTALDPIDLDASGNGSLIVDPADQMTQYTAVAINGDARSDPAGPISVHFHAPDDAVSPLMKLVGGGYAELTLLDAEGKPPDGSKLLLGAGDGLQLKWVVAGAKSARLSAKSLVGKSGDGAGAPDLPAHVSHEQLVTGLDLPLSDEGSGSGLTIVDPGPRGSAEYSLTVTTADDDAGQSVQVRVYVANFNVQLKLRGELAKNKKCVLEIPNQPPIAGSTNELGELWLWVPNTAASAATLRIFDGKDEAGVWKLALAAEDGVAEGTPAVKDDPTGEGSGG